MAFEALARGRYLRDRLMTFVVTGGGALVMLAIVLIVVYLLYMVLPLFVSASHELLAEYRFAPSASARAPTGMLERVDAPFLLELEEGAGLAARYSLAGDIVFFRPEEGTVVAGFVLPEPYRQRLSALGSSLDGRFVLYGTDAGELLVVERDWQVRYTAAGREVAPTIRYPFGETARRIDEAGRPVRKVAFAMDDDGATVAAAVQAADGGHALLVRHYQFEPSLFEEEVRGMVLRHSEQLPLPLPADFMLLDPRRRYVYVADREANFRQYEITAGRPVRELAVHRLLDGERLTSMEFLLGGRSLLAGGGGGSIHQWAQVGGAGAGGQRLRRIRSFRVQGAVDGIRSEHRRKGFFVTSGESWLGIYHATAGNRLLHRKVHEAPITGMAIAPRGDALLLATAAGAQFYRIDNPHPEISWSVLWGRVWYEGYGKPEYVWQSSSASQDFEPKFSLIPLSFGTLKATFYAILFAIPIALLGAVYTAYFMSVGMRQFVKPVIEIMEALPTVILGFLAGLWLAPYAETNLLGMLLLIPILPAVLLCCAVLHECSPPAVRDRLEKGWHAALLLPVVVATVWGVIDLGQALDGAWFDRGFIAWLDTELGMDFSQRNAAIVGVAMGFAVIPTIFSIAEDAIFAVPKHLSQGSLALGATPWQTLVHVVLLTASPGIFSAVLIGLGRVVGETMIVLMATGNTPLMDMNILHGMRTLSANIAVELPEAEVASTHFRVLYLSALVLFFFTFIFNTAGEVVRQRLRRRYGSL